MADDFPRPDPPREVQEDAAARVARLGLVPAEEPDAAARERMTAEEWAELVVEMCDGDADMTDGTRIRLKCKIGTALHAHAEQARAEEREAKDQAYSERNQLVALLARLFPSSVAKTDIPGWDAEWHGCCYIDLPTGQASWHFHVSDMPMFEDLPPYEGEWDGHTTQQKYQRLANLAEVTNGYRNAIVEAQREKLANWMLQHSFATGHGDTFEDLLSELSWQVTHFRASGGETVSEYVGYADVVRLLREACDREGGQIDFARKHDLSPAYVSDVVRERRDPGQGILAALGLVKVTLYARDHGDQKDG